MMVRVARHLTKQLEGRDVHVVSAIQFGARISDDFVLDWRARARADVARAPAVMQTYMRGGAGQVYWLTLPTARAADKTAALRAAHLSRAGGISSARMVASQLRADDGLPYSADPDGRYRRG